MIIADNIIKEKLKNVYFITGSGKTTIANEMSKHIGKCSDFFDRPDQRHMLDSVLNDESLSEEEKKFE